MIKNELMVVRRPDVLTQNVLHGLKMNARRILCLTTEPSGHGGMNAQAMPTLDYTSFASLLIVHG